MINEANSSKPANRIYDIPIKDIKIGDCNVRQHGKDKDLQELADSIELHGQLQPVVLRGEFGNPPYDLMIGQRRFLAIKNLLGKSTIRASFRGKISDTEASICSLVENMVRAELSYEDMADAITKLYKNFNKNDRKVARETGLSLKKVRQFIYIEERASTKTKDKLRKGLVRPIDVQRALRAASDDIEKADELLEIMKNYDGEQKKRMVAYGEVHPKASVKEIDDRAKQPVVERTLVVRLSNRTREALLVASKKLAMSPDEVASRAVEEWLSSMGFAS